MPTFSSSKGIRATSIRKGALYVISAAGALLVMNAGIMLKNDFGFSLNETNSLPNWAFYIDKRVKSFKRGDYVSFVAPPTPYYPKGMVFTKLVYGAPGDVVTVQGRNFYVNGALMGRAKERSQTGIVAIMSEPGVIPPGSYFVGTPHPDSLDSRYKIIGLIGTRRLVGLAHPVM